MHRDADEILHGDAGGGEGRGVDTWRVVRAIHRPVGRHTFSATVVFHVLIVCICCVYYSVWNVRVGQTTSSERSIGKLIMKEKW